MALDIICSEKRTVFQERAIFLRVELAAPLLRNAQGEGLVCVHPIWDARG